MIIEKEIFNLFKSATPNVPSIVPQSLPIPFFGRYNVALAATISLNPSDKEFLNKNGNWRSGKLQRLESYKSLNCPNHFLLTNEMIQSAYRCCVEYFERPTAYWGWFRRIELVLYKASKERLSYSKGSLAHFDLSPWVTNPVWSKLSIKEQDILRTDGLAFLNWIILSSKAKIFFLNGRTTCETLIHDILLQKIVWISIGGKWKFFSIKTSIKDKEVVFIGWNLYLQQSGQSDLLIKKIAEELDRLRF